MAEHELELNSDEDLARMVVSVAKATQVDGIPLRCNFVLGFYVSVDYPILACSEGVYYSCNLGAARYRSDCIKDKDGFK
jgi:hypothetical protein